MLEKILRIIKKLVPRPLFEIAAPFYHRALNFLGALRYGFPSRKMTVIGITGTNGKSTTVNLITAILEEAGIKTASVSSLRFKIGDKEWKNELKMTMPGRFFMQRFLARALRARATHAVIEVTSEGIRQFRHKNIKWDILALTNLTPEHIESHGGFENYKKAKGRLFAEPHKVSVVNADDESAEYFLGFSAEKKIKYGIKNNELGIKDVGARDVEIGKDGARFKVGGAEFFLPLSGEFNVYNALCAIAVARALGIGDEKIARALSRVKGVPGRMEMIDCGQSFRVVVDYAHTPDSLEKVYQTLKANEAESSKLICVLGAAGGGRDKWKRPKFGEIAEHYCDEIILTNEDPYDEDPKLILEDIQSGTKTDKAVQKILDRREAIKKALLDARHGDIVIITGKGAESVIMGPRGKRIPWDDGEVVREVFKLTAINNNDKLK